MPFAWLKRLDGTMPACSAFADRHVLLAFLDTCLRGFGQIALMNNPVTGLFIVVALFLADVQLGVMSTVGLVSATLAAYFLRLQRPRIRAGIYGYNGALVGAALASFLLPRWGAGVFVATIVVAIGSTIVWEAMGAIVSVVDMPVLTFPFNLVTIPFLWATFAGIRVERGPDLVEHALVTPVDPVLRAFEGGPEVTAATAMVNTLFRGISQLFVADSLLAGVLMVIGFLFYSRIATIMALVGSAIGGLVGIAFSANGFHVYHGLWGFNGFITAVAIGGIFFAPTWTSIVYAIVAAIAATILHGGLAVIFGFWGVPSLTLPFCLSTVTFLLIKNGTRIFHPVPLSEVTTPEEHGRRLK